jgi:hypothetical protein
LLALLTETLPTRAYALIGADRFLRAETNVEPASPSTAYPVTPLPPPVPSLPKDENVIIAWHLRNGRLKNALVAAQISPNPAIRRHLQDLRALLAGPPLHRPPFDPVGDLTTRTVDIHERLPEPNPEGLDVPLDLAGLGIAQIYAILAQAMLSGARAVGLEEPEAHLHAPTSGLHLRELLKRLVDEKHIDQLFIATHSNLFDLDATGYYDVSLKDGETVIMKRPLDAIDEHLYEPGPTRHALEELLEMHVKDDPDRVMFRYSGGTVSVREMLEMLRRSDKIALDYLEDVHRAAVDVVGLRARRKAPKAAP